MEKFELLLFAAEPALARCAADAGIDGLIIDWEYRGKRERQRGADTQINCDTVDDLRRVRAATNAPILVRISQYGTATPREIELAIDHGANEIFLPMVESAAEVRRTLDLVRGRLGVGILIETVRAVACASELGQLPLSRVFVGLNDLAIQRRERNIFLPVVDGTLDAVRRHITVPFGFGGLTLPECGAPIPCRLLLGEMARLRTSFTFLRRSFLRDTAGRALPPCVATIRRALHDATFRSVQQVTADHAALQHAVNAASAHFQDAVGVVDRPMPLRIPAA